MNYVITIGIATATFIILVLAVSWTEIIRLRWVKKELKKPYKIFKKTFIATPINENLNYHLSEVGSRCLSHYLTFDRTSLLNLKFDIELMSRKNNGNKHLVSYLTTGCLPLFSLLIAAFALFSDKVSPDKLFEVFLFSLAIMGSIILVVFLDYTSQLYIQEPMLSHLFVIEKALIIKEEEVQKFINRDEEIKKSSLKSPRRIRKKNNTNDRN